MNAQELIDQGLAMVVGFTPPAPAGFHPVIPMPPALARAVDAGDPSLWDAGLQDGVYRDEDGIGRPPKTFPKHGGIAAITLEAMAEVAQLLGLVPEGARLNGVWFDFQRDRFQFKVEHESLPAIAEGDEYPVISQAATSGTDIDLAERFEYAARKLRMSPRARQLLEAVNTLRTR